MGFGEVGHRRILSATCRGVPLRNRVTPLGELIADPARGLVYGNRGCIHDDRGESGDGFPPDVDRLSAQFKGWHRKALLQPGKFTELFFLDEATAFAAGHRPCALCRREDYNRFLEIAGAGGADEIDERLHGERLRRQRTAPPPGRLDDAPRRRVRAPRRRAVARARRRPPPLDARRATPAGQAAPGRSQTITPRDADRGVAAGLGAAVPLLHPSATAARYGVFQRGTPKGLAPARPMERYAHPHRLPRLPSLALGAPSPAGARAGGDPDVAALQVGLTERAICTTATSTATPGPQTLPR